MTPRKTQRGMPGERYTAAENPRGGIEIFQPSQPGSFKTAKQLANLGGQSDMVIQFNSPINLQLADGTMIMNAGKFKQKFDSRIDNMTLGKPDPVEINV